MTAEVCLMNRLAVVIAADSALTVTQCTDRGAEQRYFKGSNKIFQLSDHQPVGLMIFNSSDILRVPWEIVSSSFPSDLGAFAELGMLEVFKDPGSHLGSTGLVFAGFGDHDIFPAFCEYISCGIVAGKHVAIESEKAAITHDMPARIVSFAQKEMSETFSMGLSHDVYMSVMNTIDAGLTEFAADVLWAAGVKTGDVPKLEEKVIAARDEIGRKILVEAGREHAMPLRRVLGVLPVDEMANLAETLINLQSLKEKVTKNSETVGGPVDVAMITKNEGFLWIKRKHFFDINLNSRFALRRQSRLA